MLVHPHAFTCIHIKHTELLDLLCLFRTLGMITKREAERLCKSFLQQTAPPKLPENYEFQIYHRCSYGAAGSFVPTRYNSSRAKCIKCHHCGDFFSPNKFIFHSHRERGGPFVEPDAANFNSWRRHIKLGRHLARAYLTLSTT